MEQFILYKDRLISPVSIHGYPNYGVTDTGMVWSFARNRPLHGFITPGGYRGVTLSRFGKPKTCLVHRLVYEAHVGRFNPYNVVKHINGIRTDNQVENLRLIERI